MSLCSVHTFGEDTRLAAERVSLDWLEMRGGVFDTPKRSVDVDNETETDDAESQGQENAAKFGNERNAADRNSQRWSENSDKTDNV